MNAARIHNASKDVRQKNSVIAEVDLLPNAAGRTGNGPRNVPDAPLQLSQAGANALPVISRRRGAARPRQLPLITGQDGESELARARELPVNVPGASDGDPQGGGVVRHTSYVTAPS